MTLYRGVLARHGETFDFQPGETYEDRGVVSTGVSQKGARGWLTNYFREDEPPPGSVVLQLTAEPGVRMVGGERNTFEVMLQPGTKIKVTKVTKATVDGYAGEVTIVEGTVSP